MDRLAFNAAVAMNEQTIGRQMSVNELANATTTGFKRSFESAMRSISVGEVLSSGKTATPMLQLTSFVTPTSVAALASIA